MLDKDPQDLSPKYEPPQRMQEITVTKLLAGTSRGAMTAPQLELLASVTSTNGVEPYLFVAGNINLLNGKCVSIIGARDATLQGRARARRLARELSAFGIVVMSGLAEGIDSEAMRAAIAVNGHIVGVIGTPIDKAYPAQNKQLQESIYKDHLLVSQFAIGEPVSQSNFPKRNRLMALLSDATVVVEASDSSGTLHQATECVRLGRWLYIARNVIENPLISWPKRFQHYEKFRVLDDTKDLVETVFDSISG